jgi:putative transposase
MEAGMAGRIAARLELTTEQHRELTALTRAHSTPQKLAERARIVLLAAGGVSVTETARQLDIWRKTASFWRKCWRETDAAKSVAERLSDAPRSGGPGKFTPEQICAIIALACEDPEDSDLPISHWSQSEVARQAVKRGIVASISHGSVGRFFKRVSA